MVLRALLVTPVGLFYDLRRVLFNLFDAVHKVALVCVLLQKRLKDFAWVGDHDIR